MADKLLTNNIYINVKKGGDRVKAPPKLEERRISFGRHTKLGYGGREISEVGEGGRKLSKQERAGALQDMKNLHNAQIQNYHGESVYHCKC